MARIGIKNPRFRTKDEIARDIAFVLTAHLHPGTVHAVLSEAMWVWSEFDGKHGETLSRSLAASKCTDKRELCHEHIVPKRYIIRSLWELSKPTEKNVKSILSTYCIGALVTREEDQKLSEKGYKSRMPDDWDLTEVWIRYRQARIRMKKDPQVWMPGKPTGAARRAMAKAVAYFNNSKKTELSGKSRIAQQPSPLSASSTLNRKKLKNR
jgi:hypothetical protein